MHANIRRRLFVQRWLNLTSDWAGKTALSLAMLVLISHRVFSVDAVVVLVLVILMPVYTWLWLRRTPIKDRDVRQYAERSTGETGLLWFENEVSSDSWQKDISERWAEVQLPSISFPQNSKWSLIAILLFAGSLWIPLKKSGSVYTAPIVKQELSEIEQQLAMLDELTAGEDSELEEWKQQIEEISSSNDVSSSLSQIDGLSENLSTRQEEMLEALQQALDALEKGGENDLANALKDLQDQNLIPPSAKDGQEIQDSQTAPEQKDGSSQNSQSQSNQLQQEMEALKERIQSTQSAQKSMKSQLNSASNEQLQQMSKMMNQMSKSGAGEECENGNCNSDSQSNGKGENGKPCSPGDVNCVPGSGGTESAPLTFGEANPLVVPEANLSIIQGVTEVDWDQSVYFGEGPGQYSGSIIETQQQNDGISTGVTVGTTSSIAVPPNQRKVVQQYFSNESSE